MDVGYLIPETVPDRKAAIETMKKKLEFHQSKLSRETPIIIGHNFLYDLTYIYKSFYGDLPDTVIKFGRKIREIFPRVVDTKYLARRRGDHSMVADDTLRELFWSVRDQPVPKIMSDPMMTMERFTHQAGYDSMFHYINFLLSAV
jgi:poly(A)-specific ribonuclease